MAREAEHIRLANRNHKVLLFLVKRPRENAEWIATVAFYKAVQVVEAVFATHLQKHCHGHVERLNELKQRAFPIELFKSLRPLYCASSVARYLVDSGGKIVDPPVPAVSYSQFVDYLSAEDVLEKLVLKHLVTLEQHAKKFLSEGAKKDLGCVDRDRDLIINAAVDLCQ